ncbi:MAG: hypothetical protein IPN69_17980 [Acidobacteria bacterium]|nr:hypothetical protein [Acidobacteriota bacterium]MBK8151531.1 hypothetical protein [Acidobacteriota bacterium]MBK8812601.1 hypothetical protein [Acidobacteriota bacterium]
MSFNIFAAGSRGFQYTRENYPDDDVFEAASILSALRSGGPTALGVAEGVADYVVPSEGSAILDGVQAVAQITFLHTLCGAVDQLAMCSGANRGWISVAPRQTHALWPDTNRFARYDFSPGREPGAEFMRCILPILEATGMANYGVLMAMSLALSGYRSHIGSSGTPMIQIELWR